MRSTTLAVAATALVLSLSRAQVNAQDPGDPVTYTNGGVIYTASLDADLDTVGDTAVSTIAAGGAAAGAAATALSTTYDYYGNPVTISAGVTLGTFLTGPTTTAAAATTTTDDAAVGAGGVSKDDREAADHDDPTKASPEDLLRFQSFARRSPTPRPDQPANQQLFKRQAALGGGGGGVQTTQTGLQTISGYTPPDNTAVPEPDNYSSGVILSPSQIPGYTGKENSQGVTGGGVSSGSIRLGIGKAIVGAVAGAALFALL